MKKYNLFYINIKERTDRKELIEKEFDKLKNKKYNFKITRIDAIKKKYGMIGVAMSMVKELKLEKKKNLDKVIIFKDDLVIKEELVDKYFDIINNFKRRWDVIILSGHDDGKKEEKINEYMTKCKNTQCCTWYLVKKEYYDTLIKCFRESKYNLLFGFNFINKSLKRRKRLFTRKNRTRKIKGRQLARKWAIDQNWKKLQKKDNWYRFSTNLGYQRASYSDIENKFTDYIKLLN